MFGRMGGLKGMGGQSQRQIHERSQRQKRDVFGEDGGGGVECLCIIPFVFWAVLGINNVIHREAIELLSALAGRSHADMPKNENRTQDH